MKESVEKKKERVQAVVKNLKKAYPDAKCALNFSNPWELLVATVLSAQCTDKRVNMVTPELFKKFRTPKDYVETKQENIEELIRSTGFYKSKAKSIRGAAERIIQEHGGQVPKKLDELVNLPGVGRKTANVILGNAYGVPGLTVDTHMIRLNRRLGFTQNLDPVKIEYDLMALVPQKEWTDYSHLIISHGRNRCFARSPDCGHCEVQKFCPSAFKILPPKKAVR